MGFLVHIKVSSCRITMMDMEKLMCALIENEASLLEANMFSKFTRDSSSKSYSFFIFLASALEFNKSSLRILHHERYAVFKTLRPKSMRTLPSQTTQTCHGRAPRIT